MQGGVERSAGDGEPVIIEALVDANERPLPPKITEQQAKHFAESRGEAERGCIGSIVFRNTIEKATLSASPFDVLARVLKGRSRESTAEK